MQTPGPRSADGSQWSTKTQTTPMVYDDPRYTKQKQQYGKQAMKQTAALYDPKGKFEKAYSDRENNIRNQFAQLRVGLESGRQAMGQDYERALQRQAAAGGGGGSGTQAKLMERGMGELAKQYGSLEAGLGAEEAAAKEQLAGAKSAERFAREEAIRSGKQFSETLGFQEGSFADQMAYSWNELDENKKTNLINAAALLKSEGIDSTDAMNKIGMILKLFYPGGRTYNLPPEPGQGVVQ